MNHCYFEFSTELGKLKWYNYISMRQQLSNFNYIILRLHVIVYKEIGDEYVKKVASLINVNLWNDSGLIISTEESRHNNIDSV